MKTQKEFISTVSAEYAAALASLSLAAEAAWAAYYLRRSREAYQAAFQATYAADAFRAYLFHGGRRHQCLSAEGC